jgi:hypothetical protein
MNRDRQKKQQRQTTNRKEAALEKHFPRSHGQFLSAQNPRHGLRKCGSLKCQSGMKSGVRSDMSAFTSKHEVTRGTSALAAQYPAPPIPAAINKHAVICFID